MRNLKRTILALLWLFCIGARAEIDVRRDAVVEAVDKVKNSVVNINTAERIIVRDQFDSFFGSFYGPPRESERQSLGSGVIVDEEGYLLTNNHVVQRANRIQVAVGTNMYPARVIAVSPTIDVALLKVDARNGEKFRAIKIARDDDVLLGETVVALGNPFGLGFSVSRGILSSTTRRPETDQGPLDYKDWLQTDAAINPGNSGGALVDARGELIGMNVAVYREGNAQGIGFAIPIKRVAEALSEVFTMQESNLPLWFGAKIISSNSVLKVASVETESPAATAGLKAGDVISKIGDKSPRNLIEFVVEFLRLCDEQKNQKSAPAFVLAVLRGNDRINASVRMVAQKNVFNAELIRTKIGATLQEITPDLQQYLGRPTRQGLIVAGIDPGSPAEKSGLERGFIIEAIQGEVPSNLVEAAKAFYGKKRGEEISLFVTAIRGKQGDVVFQQGTVRVKVR